MLQKGRLHFKLEIRTLVDFAGDGGNEVPRRDLLLVIHDAKRAQALRMWGLTRRGWIEHAQGPLYDDVEDVTETSNVVDVKLFGELPKALHGCAVVRDKRVDLLGRQTKQFEALFHNDLQLASLERYSKDRSFKLNIRQRRVLLQYVYVPCACRVQGRCQESTF